MDISKEAGEREMIEKYECEARERWGNTDAYREHEKKTKNYTKEKWAEINDGLMAIFAEFAECKINGFAANSPEVQSLIVKLRNISLKTIILARVRFSQALVKCMFVTRDSRRILTRTVMELLNLFRKPYASIWRENERNRHII